jgi:cytochrome c553
MSEEASMTNRNTLLKSFAAAVLLAGSLPALAGGNAELGKEKATQICAACHTLTGASQNPIYPHIGGQYEDYLLHSLRGYKSGERQNAIMQGMIAPLSDEDLKNLAAYYAAQESPLKKQP